MVFEGWVVDHLSSWLGHFVELQREQLRISLWRAWRTGLTLEDVKLRPDAFEYLQLPFHMCSGVIARVQAHVPWGARPSPVVVELDEVALVLELRDLSDLCEGPARARAREAKRALLAALAAADAARGAGAGGGAPDAGAPEDARAARGLLWAMIHRALAALAGRLRLAVRGISVTLVDPSSGAALTLRVPALRTVSRAGAAAFARGDLGGWPASSPEGDPAGASEGDAAAISKYLVLEGLRIEWRPGGSTPENDPDLQSVPLSQASVLLAPTDIVVHVATSTPGAGPAAVRCEVAVPVLAARVRADQIVGILAFADAVELGALRSRHAVYCPDAWRRGERGPGVLRAMWRFAIDATIAQASSRARGGGDDVAASREPGNAHADPRDTAAPDEPVAAGASAGRTPSIATSADGPGGSLRGRRCGERWHPSRVRAHMRTRYVRLWRSEVTSHGPKGGSPMGKVGRSQLAALEAELPADEIVRCRAVAAAVAAAAAAKGRRDTAKRGGRTPALPPPSDGTSEGAASEDERSASEEPVRPPSHDVAALAETSGIEDQGGQGHPEFGATGRGLRISAQADVADGRMGLSGVSVPQASGVVSWGIAGAAGFFGYVPRREDKRSGREGDEGSGDELGRDAPTPEDARELLAVAMKLGEDQARAEARRGPGSDPRSGDGRPLGQDAVYASTMDGHLASAPGSAATSTAPQQLDLGPLLDLRLRAPRISAAVVDPLETNFLISAEGRWLVAAARIPGAPKEPSDVRVALGTLRIDECLTHGPGVSEPVLSCDEAGGDPLVSLRAEGLGLPSGGRIDAEVRAMRFHASPRALAGLAAAIAVGTKRLGGHVSPVSRPLSAPAMLLSPSSTLPPVPQAPQTTDRLGISGDGWSHVLPGDTTAPSRQDSEGPGAAAGSASLSSGLPFSLSEARAEAKASLPRAAREAMAWDYARSARAPTPEVHLKLAAVELLIPVRPRRVGAVREVIFACVSASLVRMTSSLASPGHAAAPGHAATSGEPGMASRMGVGVVTILRVDARLAACGIALLPEGDLPALGDGIPHTPLPPLLRPTAFEIVATVPPPGLGEEAAPRIAIVSTSPFSARIAVSLAAAASVAEDWEAAGTSLRQALGRRRLDTKPESRRDAGEGSHEQRRPSGSKPSPPVMFPTLDATLTLAKSEITFVDDESDELTHARRPSQPRDSVSALADLLVVRIFCHGSSIRVLADATRLSVSDKAQYSIPPPVPARFVPRLARHIAASRLSVRVAWHDVQTSEDAAHPIPGRRGEARRRPGDPAHPCAAPISLHAKAHSPAGQSANAIPGTLPYLEVDASLEDISARGYESEPGNFLDRLSPGEPANIRYTLHETPQKMRTWVTASNVRVGHATLARLAILIDALTGNGNEQRKENPTRRRSSSCNPATNGAVEDLPCAAPDATTVLGSARPTALGNSRSQPSAHAHAPDDSQGARWSSSPLSRARTGTSSSGTSDRTRMPRDTGGAQTTRDRHSNDQTIAPPVLRKNTASSGASSGSTQAHPSTGTDSETSPSVVASGAAQPPTTAPSFSKAKRVTVSLSGCHVVWRYSPYVTEKSADASPAHDALLAHVDVGALDIPLLLLDIPLQGDAFGDDAGRQANSGGRRGSGASPAARTRGDVMISFSGDAPGHSRSGSTFPSPQSPAPTPDGFSEGVVLKASSIEARLVAVGVPGHAMLPCARLDMAKATRRVLEDSRGGISISYLVRLGALELGSHPSHAQLLEAAAGVAAAEWAHLSIPHEPPATPGIPHCMGDFSNDLQKSSNISEHLTSIPPLSYVSSDEASITSSEGRSTSTPGAALFSNDTETSMETALRAGPGPSAPPRGLTWPQRARFEAHITLVRAAMLGSSAGSSAIVAEVSEIVATASSDGERAAGSSISWTAATLHSLTPLLESGPEEGPTTTLPPGSPRGTNGAQEAEPQADPGGASVPVEHVDDAQNQASGISAVLRGASPQQSAGDDDGFFDARSEVASQSSYSIADVMSRRSLSGVSRYLSAIGSTPTASQWDAELDPASASGIALPCPLPLASASPWHSSVCLLRIMRGSPADEEAGRAGGTTPSAKSATYPGWQDDAAVLQVTVDAGALGIAARLRHVTIRTHLEADAWVEAARCISTYLVLRRHATAAAGSRTGGGMGNVGETVIASGLHMSGRGLVALPPNASEALDHPDARQAAASLSTMPVSLRARDVRVEVVGASSSDVGATPRPLVPVAVLRFRCSARLDSIASVQGARLIVPAALLASSTVPSAATHQASPLRIPAERALLGFVGLGLTVDQPSASPEQGGAADLAGEAGSVGIHDDPEGGSPTGISPRLERIPLPSPPGEGATASAPAGELSGVSSTPRAMNGTSAVPQASPERAVTFGDTASRRRAANVPQAVPAISAHLSARRVTAWLCARDVSSALALGEDAASMLEQLRLELEPVLAPSVTASIIGQGKAALPAPRSPEVILRAEAHRLAVLVQSCDERGAARPLLETALTHVVARGGARGARAHVEISLLARADVRVRAGWEPVMDPWRATLRLAAPLGTPRDDSGPEPTPVADSAPHVSSAPPDSAVRESRHSGRLGGRTALDGVPPIPSTDLGPAHVRAEVSSSETLELTASESGVATLAAVANELTAAVCPSTAEKHAVTIPDAWRLDNASGSDIEVWLRAPGSYRERESQTTSFTVTSDARVQLPVESPSSRVLWTRSGVPSWHSGVRVRVSRHTPPNRPLKGVASASVGSSQDDTAGFPESSLGSFGEHATSWRTTSVGEQGHFTCHVPLRCGEILDDFDGFDSSSGDDDDSFEGTDDEPRTVLSFRIAQTSEVCGPVSLDSPGEYAFSPLRGSDVQAFVSVSVSFGGQVLVTIHSGIRLKNDSSLAVEVALRTPVGIVTGARALGVLPPGVSLWLPVLTGAPGALAVRPTRSAAAAYLSTSPARVEPVVATLKARHPSLPLGDASAYAHSDAPLSSRSGGAPSSERSRGNVVQRSSSLTSAHGLLPWTSYASTTSLAGATVPWFALDVDPKVAETLAVQPVEVARPASRGGSIATSSMVGSGVGPFGSATSLPATSENAVAAERGSSEAAEVRTGAESNARGSKAGASADRATQASALLATSAYEWSPLVSVAAMLRTAAVGPQATGAGHGIIPVNARARAALRVHPSSRGGRLLEFELSARRSATRGSRGIEFTELNLSAPLALTNGLPIPAELSVRGERGSIRARLDPGERIDVYELEVASCDTALVYVPGYAVVGPILLPPRGELGITVGGALQGAAESDTMHGASTGWSYTTPLRDVAEHTSAPGAQTSPSAQDSSAETSHAVTSPVLAPSTPDASLPVPLTALGPAHGGVDAALVVHSPQASDRRPAARTLQLGCPFWVYNCARVPLALRRAPEATFASDVHARGTAPPDDVPGVWVPPLALPGADDERDEGEPPPRGIAALARSSVGASRPGDATPRTFRDSLAGSVAGFGEPIASSPHESSLTLALRRAVVRPGARSLARGIQDSMEGEPEFFRPTRWPSMHHSLGGRPGRLRLQLCATQAVAAPGRSHWSEGVRLDALGGAAVVAAPRPLPGAPRAALLLAVTASPAPGGAPGTLALRVLPRHVLHNALPVPVQVRQAGTRGASPVPAGGARALAWLDSSRSRRVRVRVHGAGWLWSGGFDPDAPGDAFVKLRHRDRGETLLLRVDVSGSARGTLHVTLSHTAAGFAPYRLENHTLHALHARQAKVSDAPGDVIRPYCCLQYAWDEPALPHVLAVTLPGGAVLGSWDLDAVGIDALVQGPRRRAPPLRVVVRAEGPTRVLAIIDPERHPAQAPPVRDAMPRRAVRPDWEVALLVAALGLSLPGRERARSGGDQSSLGHKWPSGATPGTGDGLRETIQALSQIKVPGAGQTRRGDRGGLPHPVQRGWEHTAPQRLALRSLATPRDEIGYARLTGSELRLRVSDARIELHASTSRVQLDDPRPWKGFPVVLACPAPAGPLARVRRAGGSGDSGGIGGDAPPGVGPAPAMGDAERTPRALRFRGAIWRRRPAGVLCVEDAELHVLPVALYVQQEHAVELVLHVARLAKAARGGIDPDATNAKESSRKTRGGAASPGGEALGGLGNPELGPFGVGPGSTAGSAGPDELTEGLAGPRMSACVTSGAAIIASPSATSRSASLPATAGTSVLAAPSLVANDPGVRDVAEWDVGAASRERRLYLARVRVSPLELIVSFAPARYGGHERDRDGRRSEHDSSGIGGDPTDAVDASGLLDAPPGGAFARALLALADVEDARVVLTALRLDDAVLGGDALAARVQRHYVRALLPQAVRVVGAASLLGDPLRLVHHLRLGVWSFLATPAAGLVESAREWGPSAFLLALHTGTTQLLANVVFALSNAAAKTSRAAHRALVAVGAAREALVRPGEASAGLAVAGAARDGLLGALLAGLAGIIAEPITGAERDGFSGLLRGAGRGATGAVVLPLAALLEMLARTAASIRAAVAGRSSLGWARPPRLLDGSHSLGPYSFSDALASWVLVQLRGRSTQPKPTHTLLCIRCEGDDEWVIVTESNVLAVHAPPPRWVPTLRWSIATRDLELARAEPIDPCGVILVAQRARPRASLTRGGASLRAARAAREPQPLGTSSLADEFWESPVVLREAPPKPSVVPFDVRHVRCADGEHDARRLVRGLERAAQAATPETSWEGGVLFLSAADDLGGSW